MARSTPSLREKQKHHTRTEIVRIDFELFATYGYEVISVEMISDAVGISRATFFNYFPQKELILREIATSRVEKLKAIVTRFGESGKKLTFDDVIALFLEITGENSRIAGRSRAAAAQPLVPATARLRHRISYNMAIARSTSTLAALRWTKLRPASTNSASN